MTTTEEDSKKSVIFSLDVGGVIKKFGVAIVSAAIGAAIAFYSNEIHAYVSHMFVNGNLTGQYVVRTKIYEETTNKWELRSTNAELKHGGTFVFGTERSTLSDQSWRVVGYFRPPFLSLAYENRDSAAVGTGTYNLRQDLPFILWGNWTGVACDLNTRKRFLARCPAIAYRTDRSSSQQSYNDLLNQDCERITLDDKIACPVKKIATGP